MKGGIRGTFPLDFFDTAIALSTMEHIGLGLYGEPVDPHGDRKAAIEVLKVVKPGGRLLLTVPFGRLATTSGHCVYDATRLRVLLAGFQIQEFLHDILDGLGCWSPAKVEKAELIDSISVVRSIALLALSKPEQIA